MDLRHVTIREVDNRNSDDMLRWREAETEALRRQVSDLRRQISLRAKSSASDV